MAENSGLRLVGGVDAISMKVQIRTPQNPPVEGQPVAARVFPGKGHAAGQVVFALVGQAQVAESGNSVIAVMLPPDGAREMAAAIIDTANEAEECQLIDDQGAKCCLKFGHGGPCLGLGELF